MGTKKRGLVVDMSLHIETETTISHSYVQAENGRYDDEDFFISQFRTVFILLDFDVDEEGAAQRLGEASGFLVNLGEACNLGVSYFDVMDAHSQELMELYKAIFDSKGEEKLIDGAVSNLLYIRDIELVDFGVLGQALYILQESMGHFDLVICAGGQVLDDYGWDRLDVDWKVPVYYLDTRKVYKDFPIRRKKAAVINFTEFVRHNRALDN